ncbi:MAG TPA: hypothetical protein VMV81_06725 [Phycisphaerae bacterium]|nr:hypothetical protein [Phycisphaerae bacterium]
MNNAILMLADHGDAEWVKLIGLAIFAAISVVGSMVKKFAESRKLPSGEKTAPARPLVVPERAPRRKLKPLPKVHKAAPPVARIPAGPPSPEIATQASSNEAAPAATTGGPPRRAAWQLGSITPASLRRAVILSEILSPPLAIRELEGR